MTRVTIDASVVVKWMIPDPSREGAHEVERAADLLRAVREGAVEVVQPPHWLAETAAVVARLEPGIATEAVELLYAMELAVNQDLEVYRRATELAVDLRAHVFETLYHAAALCSAAQLVTADRAYFRKARRVGAIGLLAQLEW